MCAEFISWVYVRRGMSPGDLRGDQGNDGLTGTLSVVSGADYALR